MLLRLIGCENCSIEQRAKSKEQAMDTHPACIAGTPLIRGDLARSETGNRGNGVGCESAQAKACGYSIGVSLCSQDGCRWDGEYSKMLCVLCGSV